MMYFGLFFLFIQGTISTQCVSKLSLEKQSKENIEIFTCTVLKYRKPLTVYFVKRIGNDRIFHDCNRVINNINATCSKAEYNNGTKIILRYLFLRETIKYGSFYCEHQGCKSEVISITDTVVVDKDNVNFSILGESFFVYLLVGLLIFSCIFNLFCLIKCCVQKRIRRRKNDYSTNSNKVLRDSAVHHTDSDSSYLAKFNLWRNPNVTINSRGVKKWKKSSTRNEDHYDNIRESGIVGSTGGGSQDNGTNNNNINNNNTSSGTNSLGQTPSTDASLIPLNMITNDMASQMNRSSTFPTRQSIIIHQSQEQIPLVTGNNPNLVSYILDPATNTLRPVLNANHGNTLPTNPINNGGVYYDDTANTSVINDSGATCTDHSVTGTFPRQNIRHSSSLGSLSSYFQHHRPSLVLGVHPVSPLPEEQLSAGLTATSPLPLLPNSHQSNGSSIIADESSSVSITVGDPSFATLRSNTINQSDFNSNPADPTKSMRLELSREMMAKADTLLREAHNLLKQT